jgi:hypothetical protein
MSLIDKIPMPGTFFEGLGQGQDLMNKFLNAPYEREKSKSEAEANKAKALESRLLNQYLESMYGNGNNPQSSPSNGYQNNSGQNSYSNQGPPQQNQSQGAPQGYQLTPEQQEASNNLQPGQSYTVPGDPSQEGQQQTYPSYNSNPQSMNSNQPNNITQSDKQRKVREILMALGKIKETPSEQQGREVDTARQKAFMEHDLKAMDQWNEKLEANYEIKPLLEHNQEILASPIMQDMYKNPEYFGRDIAYLRRFGTPEQVEALTQLGVNNKSIIASSAQEFKGAFREFELKLLNNSAITENDTFQQMKSKTNTVLALRDLLTKRLTLANEIVRSFNGKISPANALSIADKQINGKKVREQIRNQFDASEKEQKEAKMLREKQEKEKENNPNGNSEGKVILYKNGNPYSFPPNLKKKALEEGFTNGK